jgi:hypothetical protein
MTDLETELCVAWSQRRRAQAHAHGDDGEYYQIVLAQWRKYIKALVQRIRAERAVYGYSR